MLAPIYLKHVEAQKLKESSIEGLLVTLKNSRIFD